MHNKLFFVIYILLFLNSSFSEETEEVETYMPNPDSVSLLLTTQCDSRLKENDQNINFILNFSQGHPLFYFELSPFEKKIYITLVNTRLGGFMQEEPEKIVNKGPLKKVAFIEELKNKNQDVVGLTPEFYYVTTMIMECDPLIVNPANVIIKEKNETITISLPWPSNILKRKELYSPPKSKNNRKVFLTLAGIGAAGLAGGGILLWNLLSNDNEKAEDLQPVLPTHP
jgi:hypothetical protein